VVAKLNRSGLGGDDVVSGMRHIPAMRGRLEMNAKQQEDYANQGRNLYGDPTAPVIHIGSLQSN
jgi:hypothetical protein